MSNGFSWDKVLGSSPDADSQEATSPAPSAPEQAAPAPSFADAVEIDPRNGLPMVNPIASAEPTPPPVDAPAAQDAPPAPAVPPVAPAYEAPAPAPVAPPAPSAPQFSATPEPPVVPTASPAAPEPPVTPPAMSITGNLPDFLMAGPDLTPEEQVPVVEIEVPPTLSLDDILSQIPEEKPARSSFATIAESQAAAPKAEEQAPVAPPATAGSVPPPATPAGTPPVQVSGHAPPVSESPVPFHVLRNESSINPLDRRDEEERQDILGARSKVDEDVKDLTDAHIDDLLRLAVERRASDIHITVGLPPMMRLDGEVVPLPWSEVTPLDARRLIYDTLNDDQLQKFEQTHELDFGYMVKGLGRFRFNVYMQRGSVAGAMRAIPTKIPSFEQLELPLIIKELSKRASGLVLVTGPTGSGKSTTIATMIDDINETRQGHIITIEDPIEYLHTHKKCMVNQRELHADTYTFHNALRAVLREDPDIILVGELRDLETIEAALTLAETGHLVFGTLHTRNAPATMDRIIDVFPSDQQDQIRVLLGNTIEAVVSQQLLPRVGGGRKAALEIMVGTPAIKNLIREGKTHQMYSVIETSRQQGMLTMDSSLADIYRAGISTYEECLMRSVDKENFARMAKGTSAKSA